jgi:hypothetical protein
MIMHATLKYSRNGLMVAILLALLAPIAAWAQPAPPPTPSFEDRARKKTTLDRDSKEVADEYADLLVELQTLVADYRDYLSESDSPTITKYLVKLDKLAVNLDKNLYVTQRSRLSADLTAHIDDLEEIETYIEDSEEIFSTRILKLVSSLARDLSNINDLLEDDLLDRMDEVTASDAALQAAIEDLLEGMKVETHGDRTTITIPNFDEKKLKEMERQAQIMSKEAEEIAEKREKIRVKSRTKSEPLVIDLQGLEGLTGIGTGTSKELDANLAITNPRLPIKISNPVGEVTVGVTQSKQIIAHLVAEISADSRTKEKQLLSEIELQVEATASGYLVTAIAPSQGRNSNDCRIVSNQLEVLVPSSNPVVVNNAFGAVSVSDLNGGADITSSYAPIEVESVKGGVTVSNNMGQVSLLNCSGPIRVKGAYAGISLEGCTGEMDVENAYSEIALDGCSGRTTLENSGVIRVSDHTGDLKITNSFGPVDVDGLNGNLNASNQFQPMSVRDIKGTVSVENSNSNIDLANISGQLVATNKFGMIQAEELAGPSRLNNQNGNIMLVLDNASRGNSWIYTSFGNVDVTISESTNFWVNAKTTFGEISSDIPLKLDDLGTAKMGWFKLGRGSDSLSISGQNTNITISGSK